MEQQAIRVRGDRVHNLKNVSCEVPIGTLTVVTGVSGSGKSSLAFDTIFAEGQRRYVQSLSAYARQFLERMSRPDVDEITGICPAIAIQQKPSSRNPRSTVATQTEIYDYLRLLFARVGQTICLKCGVEVKRDTAESIADEILQLPEGTRFYVLFPALTVQESEGPNGKHKVRTHETSRKLQTKAQLMSLLQRGFTRIHFNDQVFELACVDTFPFNTLDGVSILVDRLAVSKDIRSRLVDSLEICYREGKGHAEVYLLGGTPRRLQYSEALTCPLCHTPYASPDPRLFSFNSAYGACPTCQGFGNRMTLDLTLVIPNEELSLEDGAIEPWTKPQFEWAQEELLEFCQRADIPTRIPVSQLPREQQQWIINGKGDFMGVRGFFDWLETKKYKLYVRVFLSKYRGYATCPDCNGARLKPEALAVRVAGKTLPDICSMSIASCSRLFETLELSGEALKIAERPVVEIARRLRFLIEVGLDYLTLDRLSSTLSGGEAQRIHLAANLGSYLVGTLYVLDEPSIGLHARDIRRLIAALKKLRDLGNTVLVVEHDPEMISEADRIIDLGPGAGEYGGEVVFEGCLNDLLASTHSLTGKYLRGELKIQLPAHRRAPSSKKLAIHGARANNLKNINVEIPLGLMVCITGVSGSGKSTLVHDVLYANLQKERGAWTQSVGAVKKIKGGHLLDDIILVDQAPIGRTPRSNPATYIKIFDSIRDLFAATREAQARRLTSAYFSFNVPGGRCDVCGGNGVVTIEMQFLADVELVCEQCKGARFKQNVLEVRYRGKNVNEILDMTVREAMQFFSDVPRITRKLQVLDEVGLGYLRLGQSATTLSGGEAQRLKLAYHLAKEAGDRSLYIFDEPTTGLHFDDVHRLLSALRRLMVAGGSIIIIEHNLEIIKCADWIIDLGPEGGDEGGYIIAQGPPEEIIKVPQSHTGRFLAKYVTC